MKKAIVTGASSGIGKAICKQGGLRNRKELSKKR